MNWPPIKAWTSKVVIGGQVHFVAINYGGELLSKWVVMMSVLDSSVVLKVSLSQLVDSSKWESGWHEINYSDSSKLVNNKSYLQTFIFPHLSSDSGLTIPITRNNIRPWFDRN